MSVLESFGVLPQGPLFGIQHVRPRMRPFIKWAGGKTRLLDVLNSFVPSSFKTYHEPFLGGAALFFSVLPDIAVLSDSNLELIHCYNVVRDFPERLIERLSQVEISEAEFYRVRALDPETLSELERAARFIYLNKTCYNGLYRVNKQGKFNTPFGRDIGVSLVDETNLFLTSRALKNATIICQDYQAVLPRAREGDFIYFDPPYMPVSKYSDFKRYTKDFFHESDHVRLSRTFTALVERGCHVLMSNSCHPKIAALYSQYHQTKVDVPRFVNCKGNGRGAVTELLISSFTPDGGM